VIGISRRGRLGPDDLRLDLSDPSSWSAVDESFRTHLRSYRGERVAFFHAAADLRPIGFAGELDAAEYTRSVLLNSAAPQVLGNLFVSAARDVDARRFLVLITSAGSGQVMPGVTSYISGKTALDQWVRIAGAEQSIRSGIQVLAVNPGSVDTPMQQNLREADASDLPRQPFFVELHRRGGLLDPGVVAGRIWTVLDEDVPNGSVIDVNLGR
jgi:NAD(P)-dependent dehydrogenase (short-subunit alcohol dehydrogenase family)